MTKEEALKELKKTDFAYSVLCEAVQVAIKSLEKDIKQEDKNDTIFTGTKVHYELRNSKNTIRSAFDGQKSQEEIKTWFKKNCSATYFPEDKYVIVKVTETEKVEVVEELGEV